MALISGNLLTENQQSIETSVDTWGSYHPSSSAVTRSTTQKHDGAASLRCTYNGTVNDALASLTDTGSAPSVTAGTTYTFYFWVYSPRAVNFHVFVDWYNAANSSWVDDSSADVVNVSVAANTWTKVSNDLLTPTGAGTARLYLMCTTGLTNGDFVYCDEIFFGVPSSGSPDTTPPTAPSSLTVTGHTASSVSLSWSASSDDTAVTGYSVIRDGSEVDTTASTTYTDNGLSASTSYVYTVKAFDAASNLSNASNAATGTTDAVTDVTAPTVPTGLHVTGHTSDSVSLSWNASTDAVGVAGYTIVRDNVDIDTTALTMYTDSGLDPSTAYAYKVKAFDAANNTSAASSAVTGTTDAAAGSASWTYPMTAVGNSVFTAAQYNTYVRDNLLGMGAAQAAAGTDGSVWVSRALNEISSVLPKGASVSTSQSRTGTTYGNLTTSGPAVTVSTGTSALVWISCAISNDEIDSDVQATSTYTCTDSASYQESGNLRSGIAECYQGRYSATNGNQWSLIAFPYATIQDDLAGATINKVELYLDNVHFYQNAGGQAIIGTHTYGTTTGDANYANVNPDITRASFTYGQAKWVTVSNSIGTALKNDTARGIALGKGPTTSQNYYGFFRGAGQSGQPQLRITYTTTADGGALSKASFAVSGATTIDAQDSWGIYASGASVDSSGRWGVCHLVTGLTPGSNTFTMKYRVDGSGTGTFANRHIAVLPL